MDRMNPLGMGMANSKPRMDRMNPLGMGMNPLAMGKRAGYEYQYGFRVYNDVIPQRLIDCHEVSIEKKVYIFYITTNFTIRRRMDDKLVQIGSEKYCMSMHESEGETWLRNWMSYRLEAYWIPDEEIELVVSEAFYFAKRCSVADDAQLVIPVSVDLRVCTVQLEEESMDDAYERAIRVEHLIPLYLGGRCNQLSERIDSNLQSFLKNMKRIRVEDVAKGMGVMEECSVCLRKPTIGAEISKIPSCGHGFHSHCIVPWLIKSNSCPLCRSKAHDFPVCTDLPKIVC